MSFSIALPFVNNIRPVAFHPYTSHVHKRILEIECGGSEEGQKAYTRLENYFVDLFRSKKIDCAPDNKIVFTCTDGERIFHYGFYDWRISVGFDYSDENEVWYKQRYFRSGRRKV